MRIPLALDVVFGTAQSPDMLRSVLSINFRPITTYLHSWAVYSTYALRTGALFQGLNSKQPLWVATSVTLSAIDSFFTAWREHNMMFGLQP